MTANQPADRHTAPGSHPHFSEAERGAMRAYLQRCEVRLSTLHRIATAFISGAGLLLLIPVFVKDAIDSILQILLLEFGNHFPQLGSAGLLLSALMYLALAYPLLLSLAIPLYGVYLLLKDIVHFYFTIYTPGFSEHLVNPTFAMTGVMFSVDESSTAKHEVMRYQYEATQLGFMLPFSRERRELYFDSVIEQTKGDIIPQSRKTELLREQGVLPPNYDRQKVEEFNAALGIARALDRTLEHEVAMTEMSLVRHVLYLRRLVLRYVKTLLMFLWTTLIAFIMLPLLRDQRFPTLVILALGYVIWSVSVVRIIHLPISWIYRHRYGDVNFNQVDPQLMLMENTVRRFCNLAAVPALVALALALVAYF